MFESPGNGHYGGENWEGYQRGLENRWSAQPMEFESTPPPPIIMLVRMYNSIAWEF